MATQFLPLLRIPPPPHLPLLPPLHFPPFSFVSLLPILFCFWQIPFYWASLHPHLFSSIFCSFPALFSSWVAPCWAQLIQTAPNHHLLPRPHPPVPLLLPVVAVKAPWCHFWLGFWSTTLWTFCLCVQRGRCGRTQRGRLFAFHSVYPSWAWCTVASFSFQALKTHSLSCPRPNSMPRPEWILLSVSSLHSELLSTI